MESVLDPQDPASAQESDRAQESNQAQDSAPDPDQAVDSVQGQEPQQATDPNQASSQGGEPALPTAVPVHNTDESELQTVKELAAARDAVIGEIEKRIVGQREVIQSLLTALFARGHCLFVGVPGLAKTLLISTLAETLNLQFQRIQFTPDLMPSDITGTDILEQDQATGQRTFRFIQGANLCQPVARG